MSSLPFNEDPNSWQKAYDGVERCPHLVGDGGGEEFLKVIFQLDIFVLDKGSDILDDHQSHVFFLEMDAALM